MSPPRNESDASGREPGALEPSPFLQRKGVLSQGGDAWAEAVCVGALGDALLLSPIPRRGSGGFRPGAPASFRIVSSSGLLAATGTLQDPGAQASEELTRHALALRVAPGGVERVNRREFYRVNVGVSGKVIFCPPAAPAEGAARSGLPSLEALGRSFASPPRPCVVKDLSLGGARVAVGSPAPRAGERAFLTVVIGPAEALGPLPALVVHGREGAHPAPTDASVRLRFDRLPAALEGRLNRYLTQMQRDQLKAGVRG